MSLLFWIVLAYGSTGVLAVGQGKLKTIDEALLVVAIAVATMNAYWAIP